MLKTTLIVSLAGLVALASVVSCGERPPTFDKIIVTPLDSPAGPVSSGPNLCSATDGRALLSWIEKDSASSSLMFASWQNGSWSPGRTIATGTDWFCNWADFPAMAALSKESYMASWLAKSSAGTYSYDIYLTQTADGGQTWTEAIIPHDDGTPTEHGFVAMRPLDSESFAVAWLDGRQTVDENGSMTLRYAAIKDDGTISDEAVVDDRVCDCCQTAMTIAGDGSILICYRDRSDEEIRDISIVRFTDGEWSQPAWVAVDGWQIEGCPVNGPAMDSSDSLVVVSWFTMGANDSARVYASFSNDNGQNFAKPIRIDSGDPMGRVDVVMLDAKNALVSWLEKSNDTTRIAVRSVDPTGVASDEIIVSNTKQSRSSGFVRTAVVPQGVLIGWTDASEPSLVRSALISFE